MTDRRALGKLVAAGESRTLELKRSTGELREAMQTLCAFANGPGGKVVIGVKPNGQVIGQQVSEQTLHAIAAARDRFEPPLDLDAETVKIAPGRSVLVLSVAGVKDSVPFTFEGRAFERVGNTTRKMAQERYEALLFERAHSRRRWENQIADEITLKDIDRDEVFRIARIIESSGRLTGPSGKSLPDVLDRLGLRKDGNILRAAVVLFGKTSYRTIPSASCAWRGSVASPRLSSSISASSVGLPSSSWRRPSSSASATSRCLRRSSLAHAHLSVQRNPIIADVFHRTGLIEKWGRGTNRVAEMCEAAGIAPPKFEEITGAAVVTFRVPVAGAVGSTGGVAPPVALLMDLLAETGPLGNAEIRARLKLKDRAHLRERYLNPALESGFVEMTLPGRPNSRLQKYKLTERGRAALAKAPPGPVTKTES